MSDGLSHQEQSGIQKAEDGIGKTILMGHCGSYEVRLNAVAKTIGCKETREGEHSYSMSGVFNLNDGRQCVFLSMPVGNEQLIHVAISDKNLKGGIEILQVHSPDDIQNGNPHVTYQSPEKRFGIPKKPDRDNASAIKGAEKVIHQIQYSIPQPTVE